MPFWFHQNRYCKWTITIPENPKNVHIHRSKYALSIIIHQTSWKFSKDYSKKSLNEVISGINQEPLLILPLCIMCVNNTKNIGLCERVCFFYFVVISSKLLTAVQHLDIYSEKKYSIFFTYPPKGILASLMEKLSFPMA